ncbi:hypothetical protein [Candidatus Enterococcus lemimoniae]|uniref:hypothetical protein n=1 Tax=Enterococcus TaxID=1350 RepID=UPI00111CB356
MGLRYCYYAFETEELILSDIAFVTNIKTDSLSCPDCFAKYNQLVCIEEQLGGLTE